MRKRHDWRQDFERAWRRSMRARYQLDSEAQDTVRLDIMRHIERWSGLDRDEGRLACRNELMDSIERAGLQSALRQLAPEVRQRVSVRLPEFGQLNYDPDRHLQAERLRIEVLRAWTGYYFGDRANGDWYDVYTRAAGMRLDSIRRDFERIAGQPIHAIENNRDAAIRGLNAALRLRLMQMPPARAVTHRSLRTRLRRFIHKEDQRHEQDG